MDEALFGWMPVYIPNLEMVFASILARCSLHASVNGDFSCHGQVIGSVAFTLTAPGAWHRLPTGALHLNVLTKT